MEGGIGYLNPSICWDGFSPPPGLGEPMLLNAILSNRRSVYGWTGWQALHMNNNKILQKERDDCKLSIKNPDYSITRYDNPPVTMDGRPVWVNLDYNIPTPTNVTLEMPYGEKQFFNTNALNDRFAIDDFSYITQFEQLMQVVRGPDYKLNWVVYRECIFPADRNEFLTYSRERTGYNNEFWRDDRTDRQTLGALLTTSFGYTNVCQSSWLLDAPYNFTTRTTPGELCSFTNAWTGSNLAQDMTTIGCAGELQNIYSSYLQVDSAWMPIFNGLGGSIYILLCDLGDQPLLKIPAILLGYRISIFRGHRDVFGSYCVWWN